MGFPHAPRRITFPSAEDLFGSLGTSQNYPPCNAYQDSDKNITVELAVAGFSPDQLDINFDGYELTVEGKSKTEVEQREWFIHGLAQRDFKRRFTVKGSYELAWANLYQGILTIKLKNSKSSTKVEILSKEPEQLLLG